MDVRPCVRPNYAVLGQVPIHGGGFGTFGAVKSPLSGNSHNLKKKGTSLSHVGLQWSLHNSNRSEELKFVRVIEIDH